MQLTESGLKFSSLRLEKNAYDYAGHLSNPTFQLLEALETPSCLRDATVSSVKNIVCH